MVLFFSFLLLVSSKVLAYPQFIGHGYHSCLTCHYNPFGNGPLTDYGRALGATLVSDRLIHSKKTTEEEIAKKSGFMYMEAFQKNIRPSADYRGLFLQRSAGTSNEEKEWIHMQGNVNLTLKFGDRDQYIATATYGYAPTPRSSTTEEEPNYRTREHYIAYRPTNNIGVYAGLMDKVFGLRVPEHIAFSRTITSLTMNDQSHGVVLHVNGEKFDYGLHGFVGNLDQEDDIRQVGGSTQLEYSVTKDTRLGASYLTSKSESTEYTMTSAHSRSAVGKGSSLMLEVGQVNRKFLSLNRITKSRYAFFQNHIRARRGLYIFATLEYLRADIEESSKVYRMGPGIQWFPMRSLELRTDIYNSRIVSDIISTEDTWDVTAQIHLWF